MLVLPSETCNPSFRTGETFFIGFTIEEGTKIICDNAFEQCRSLESITLPDSILKIGDGAFNGCGKLNSINLPNNLLEIGDRAFEGCRNLKTINIPANLKMIGTHVFSGCDLSSIIVDRRNAYFDSREDCNAIIEKCTNTLIYGCASSIIPMNISAIGDYAFENVRLNSIIIPNGVKSIGTFAFSRQVPHTYLLSRLEKLRFGNKLSSDYKKIFIPESVNKIGIGAFYGYGDFSIEVDTNNRYYDSRNQCNAIIDTINKTLLIGCSSSKIPVGIKKIESYAFGECIDIESIRLPEGLEIIGSKAFESCNHLLSIEIPNSVVSIGKDAFAKCEYLQSVTLSNNLKRIEDSMFRGCFRLHAISIPESVSVIGDYAFEGCKNLIKVELPNSIKTIGHSAFSGCNGITSLSIPPSVTSIGRYSFCNCCISSIKIPESVTLIEPGAFACYGLTTIVVDQGNRHFDSRYNCNAIIETNSNLLKVGCSSTSIPDNVLVIEDSAFYGYNELKEVTIPKNVRRIGDYAFAGCTDLETIEFLGIIESAGDHIFDEDSGLPSIIVPNRTRLKYGELLPNYKTNLYERVIVDNHKGLKRAFSKEEIETVNKAEVVQGTYTKMVCFHLSDGCQKYIPLCKQSVLSLGDSVDLHKAELIILDGEGINYGIGADGRDDIQKYIVEV